jgi:DNA-binding transcriptional regulator PaaX
MTNLEHQHAQRARRTNLQKIILETVAIAGIVSVALIAPNCISVMEKMGLTPGKRQRESIKTTRARLIKKGLLVYERGSLRLTKKGEEELLRMSLQSPVIPKKWDGKWRILIFDIPETRKITRRQLRRSLISTGFVRLQDSVWLYPYDCEEYITLLKAEYRIGKNLLYIIADALENDAPYKKQFGLPT